MIKNWNQFNESISEDTEDLFTELADKYELQESRMSHMNSYYIHDDHIAYGKEGPPIGRIGRQILNIYIDKKRAIDFEIELHKNFLKRLEKFGYNPQIAHVLSMNNGQKYFHITIDKAQIDESFGEPYSGGFSPRDIRVEREEFLDRESELKRSNFTDKEIESIKEITDFENSYLQLSHKLTPLTTGSTVSFNTLDGHFWVVVIKCEDEWYLIEERPKRTKWGQGSPGYLIADGFEQVEEFLKWYVGK